MKNKPDSRALSVSSSRPESCEYCKATRQIVTDHPTYGPEVTPCPDCEDSGEPRAQAGTLEQG